MSLQILLSPEDQAKFQQAIFFHQRNQIAPAQEIYLDILKRCPQHFDILHLLGVSFYQVKNYSQALNFITQAIAINPNNPDFYYNCGNAAKDSKQLDLALARYDKAISLKPNYPEAYHNRGNILRDLKKLDLALTNYNKAIQLKPEIKFLFGMIFYTKNMLCDWARYHEDKANLEIKIQKKEPAVTPFILLSIIDSPALQNSTAEIYAPQYSATSNLFTPIAKRARSAKIRIGYYSTDFHAHAMGYLMANLYESHDKSKFELIGFSLGLDHNDDMRKRISQSFDKFIDVKMKSDLEITKLSRELEIDVAVDLNGFTQNMRLGIFSNRCAPIQVNYLGYPGTMAAPYMDYIIADKVLIPKESKHFYSEKIVYLPNSYQVNDAKRKISDKVFNRAELGLPEDGFVFCCFNNNYKISPQTFDIWMKILKAVKGSVIWLFEDNIWAAENLRKEAQKRGVESSRLIFAKRMPMEEHLARHKCADLFLDTLPYNAHTTCSDALWAGLPVLTLIGKSFASRVAASLLNAIRLPELITNSEQEYEAKAIELALNSQKLKEVKEKLEKHKLTTPLFDTKLFAKHIEAAYEDMYEKYQEGLPASDIEIKS